MRGLLLAVTMSVAVCVHLFTLGKAADAMRQLPKGEDTAFILPSRFLRITALEYRGLVSDVLFLKTMTFIGEASQRIETPKIKQWEWHWIAGMLDAATDLDPHFVDPYYYANAFFPWDANMVEEADRLLEKGSRYRSWDWMLPFFIGFNEFFFLQNDTKAAEYLMEASRRPGGAPFLASIASRLAFKEGRTETALYFLEEIAKRTESYSEKKRFEVRIRALRTLLILEKSVAKYKKMFGRYPGTVDELVRVGIIRQVPPDPYGGSYSISPDGKVSSSVGSELEPYLSPFAKKFKNR